MDADTSRALLSRAIARVANRDSDALKYVYRHTSAKLFGVCLRILNDREEAEDVLQDVYLTVWNKADRFDAEKASPITWLVSLARNRSIDRLRARGARGGSAVTAGVEEAEAPARRRSPGLDPDRGRGRPPPPRRLPGSVGPETRRRGAHRLLRGRHL